MLKTIDSLVLEEAKSRMETSTTAAERYCNHHHHPEGSPKLGLSLSSRVSLMKSTSSCSWVIQIDSLALYRE